MIRVLFVCMGNICRSPAAHCVFQKMVDEAGMSGSVEVDSAGTIGFHAGAPPDRRMQQAMQKRDIPVFGRSRQFRPGDFEEFDLILAMDNDNLWDIHSLAGNDSQRSKARLFSEFCSRSQKSEVPDPYYGGNRGFDTVLDMIEDGCEGLLDHLKNNGG